MRRQAARIGGGPDDFESLPNVIRPRPNQLPDHTLQIRRLHRVHTVALCTQVEVEPGLAPFPEH